MSAGSRSVVKSLALALVAAGALSLGLSPAQARAQTAAATAGQPAALAAYGRLPAFSSPRLSPDGTKLAYVVPSGEGQGMVIMNLANAQVVGGLRTIPNRVRAINWISNDYILITTETTAVLQIAARQDEYTQGLIYKMSDRSTQTVFGRNDELLRVMLGSPMARQTPTGVALFVEGFNGRDGTRNLYRVDPETNRATVAARGANVMSYMVDTDGDPVARATYFSDRGTWGVDVKKDGGWPTVWSTRALLDQPSLVGFGRTARSVIVQAKMEGDEEPTYRELSLDTGAWSELPFAKKPDSLIFHPVTKLLVGAVTDGEKGPEYEFLDPVASRTWRSVAAAFAGKDPSMRSLSDSLRQIIVFTDGSHDSGTYQLVDLDRHVAEIVGQSYPDIGPDQVGEIRTISYAAADGFQIPGYLTLPPGVTDPKNLPLVVMPHGGPQARDSYGFDWWAQSLASRGYAVLQPNYRGSDGLGEAHLRAGYGQWGRKMQTDLSDGVRWLAGEGIIDPKRVCIVGASYGGYAAMAGPTVDPGVYRCAVAVAGVSDLNAMIQWSGDGSHQAPVVRYWMRFMGADHLGDPALNEISPALLADRADAPILLIHGYEDTTVPFDQSARLASALRRAGKPVELIPLPGEDHHLSSPGTRARMVEETVRFVEANNPSN